MIAVADRPEPLGVSGIKNWMLCGQPVQVPGAPGGYVAMPFPWDSTTNYLSVDNNGKVSSAGSIGPNETFQLKGNFLECERAGTLVFVCIPDLN